MKLPNELSLDSFKLLTYQENLVRHLKRIKEIAHILHLDIICDTKAKVIHFTYIAPILFSGSLRKM